MPNFDALRSAIIGPLEYICRPKKVTPSFLFNLSSNTTCQAGNGSFSKTGGNVQFKSDVRTWPEFMIFGYNGGSPTSATFSTTDYVGSEWSLEYFCDWWYYSDRDCDCILDFAGFTFTRRRNALKSFVFGGSTISIASHTYTDLSHMAFVYTGGNLRIFENGTLIDTKSVALSANPQSATFQIANDTVTGFLISNLRLVPKAIGTSSTYPVPSGLYTGNEIL